MPVTPDLARIRACLAPEPVAATAEDDFTAGKTVDAAKAALIPSAVLFPLAPRAGGLRALLTRRAEHLRDHPGQISFPGGRMEQGDISPTHTALREAEEEIGIAQTLPQILGYLPAYRTATGFLIYPIVALLPPSFTLTLDAFEVAEAFEVPLARLFDPANQRRESILYKGKEHACHVIDCTSENQPRRIWGATAGIILALARRLEGQREVKEA
ncbi:MAG: CoA pyrophosphatase [Zoogloeaceae bacterium]|jgi:8-oxo-dGTP pyrophosphatase MutT (NUDIX family)|nr:CoA pyrophosphatase [Zoogloeaceae bacterium]